MSPTIRTLAILAALGSAAMGGVFFAFSAFIMPALGRLPAASGIAAMQSINVTAVRPALMTALFGTAAICVALGIRAVTAWGDRRAALLLAGAVLYLVGIIVLTGTYSVPLNNALAGLDPHAADAATRWADYQRSWTGANSIRALAGLAAAAAFVSALLVTPPAVAEGMAAAGMPATHRTAIDGNGDGNGATSISENGSGPVRRVTA